MAEAGSPTRTFLFTDIEGSTRLWEEEPGAMRQALARHDQMLRSMVETHGGAVFSTGGDGFAVAFQNAGSALRAAVDGQRALVDEEWPVSRPIRVRMGLHTGEAVERDGNFFGPGLNRCARLMGVAHGGQIVCSETTAALVRELPDSGVSLLDLGAHRLRDLSRAVQVFQVIGPALHADFPPLRSLDAFPSNLPAQLTAFIGRSDEVTAVAKALQDHRLVTVTGVGGVGKTRLALQVAAEVLPAFGDGAWLVELGGVADPGAIDEALTAALSVPPVPGQSLRESVLSFVRGRHLLLILDNCEHLLEPVADLVERMLLGSGGVAVLATSREGLGVAGEHVFSLRSLRLPVEGTDLPTAAETDAVRLFTERAGAARADFTLTPDNAAAVASLCRRLDGIPLAIELAAARVRGMSPKEISTRLDQRFRLLTGGTRRTTNRHQTLRRAIDWSWDLLEDPERTVMQRLAVCAGGFDLEAAETIAVSGDIDAFDVADILGHLVDKSLVMADDLGESTRFRLLETIREYAWDRLEEAGQVDEARSFHARHYATWAEEAAAGLRSGSEQEHLERVEHELDNLRLAVSWAAESGQPDLALRIVHALFLHGLRIETSVAAWAQLILETPGAEGDPRYPSAMACAAWNRTGGGHFDDGVHMARRALEAALPGSDGRDAVRAKVLSTLTGMLGIDPTLHEPDLAVEWVELAARLEDPYEQALAHAMLSLVGLSKDPPAAIDASRQGVSWARRSGSPTALAYTHLCLGQALGASDIEAAVRMLEESLRHAEAAGNDYATWVVGTVRAALLQRAGDPERALRAFLDVGRRSARAGNRHYHALCLWNAAAVLGGTGRDEPALVLLGWARSILGANPAAGSNQAPSREAVDALLARTDPAEAEALLARGAQMSDEEAMVLAEETLQSA